MKSGRTGQTEKPLSTMTIQEKRLLGNRVSLRRTGMFSGKKDRDWLFKLAVIISSAVLCSARAG
jgi:hypothetical protein